MQCGILTLMPLDSVQVMVEAFKRFAQRFRSPLIGEGDGIAHSFGNVPLLFFNAWIQTRPASTPTEMRSLLQTGIERAATCSYPAAGILRPDWLPAGWEELVREAGLAPLMSLSGMEALHIIGPRRLPPSIQIRRVTDEATARDLAEVNALAYGMPKEGFECMANFHFWDDSAFAGWVGYVDGNAVSTAAALPVAGTVYIAMVATLPGQQGKGYADTVVRHAIAQGRLTTGAASTTLHATPMGEPVYRAMGYALTAGFTLVTQQQ